MKLTVQIHKGNRSNTSGDCHPHIEINDKASGLRIADITMTAAAFGELMASNGYVSAELEIVGQQGYENLGKKKEIARVGIPKGKIKEFFYKERELKSEHIRGLMMKKDYLPEGEGWMIWDDGVGTQQPSLEWQVIYCRYV